MCSAAVLPQRIADNYSVNAVAVHPDIIILLSESITFPEHNQGQSWPDIVEDAHLPSSEVFDDDLSLGLAGFDEAMGLAQVGGVDR